MRHGRGFTLIELLIVVTIIGVLAGLFTPVVQHSIHRVRTVRTLSSVKQVANAWVTFYQDFRKLPPPGLFEEYDVSDDILFPMTPQNCDVLNWYSGTEKTISDLYSGISVNNHAGTRRDVARQDTYFERDTPLWRYGILTDWGVVRSRRTGGSASLAALRTDVRPFRIYAKLDTSGNGSVTPYQDASGGKIKQTALAWGPSGNKPGTVPPSADKTASPQPITSW